MSEFAGTLTQRIEIWRRVDGRPVGVLAQEDWQFVLRCFANVEAEGFGSSAEAMTISALPRYRVIARPNPSFTIDAQIRWHGKKLMVRQLNVDPATPDRVICRCEELR